MPKAKDAGATGEESEDRRREFGTVSKRGKSFVARWTEPNGKRRDKRFPSLALAHRHLDLKATEFLRAQILGVEPVESITFDALLGKYASIFRGLKSASVLKREEAFLKAKALPRFKGRAVETITRAEVERFLTLRSEAEGAGPATRNRTLSMLSAMFKRAVRLGHARENPCAGIERARETVREPVFLTLADQDRVIAECPVPLRWAVAVLLDTGLRTGEALRLAWADYNPERGTLTVRESKNKTPRTVPVTARGRAALDAHRATGGGGGPASLIFADLTGYRPSGEPQFNGEAWGEWKKARKRAKLPGLRIHDLRHSFAATAARAGVPLTDLQRLLGHKTMTMTMRYAGHAPANAGDLARERLEALNGITAPVAEAQ
jgi:integrase